MSRNKHKKEVINETENQVTKTEEGEVKDMTEKEEKKNVFEKIGEGVGNAVNGVVKVAKSKPAKFLAVACSFTNGMQYSDSTDKSATALEAHKSNFSL